MNKINLQSLSLSSNLKDPSSIEEEGDVLSSFFSIPVNEQNNNEIKEFIIPKNYFNLSKSNKTDTVGKLLIKHNPESLNLENKLIATNNTSKILNTNKEIMLEGNKESKTIFVKSKKPNKITLKIDILDYFRTKKPLEVKALPNSHSKQEDFVKVKTQFNNLKAYPVKNILKNQKIEITNFKYELKDIKKIDVNLNSSENSSIIQEKLISMETKPLKINNGNEFSNLKLNNENMSFISNTANKLGNLNFDKNPSNGQNNFTNDRNMNFVLDNFIEQLDLSEKGWTEKLVMRVEKALLDGTEEIELFLKPKELGSLKINLSVNKNNAKIIFKAENHFTIQSLQQNEVLLSKYFNDQGINIEKTNYENSNFLMNNNENFNSNAKKNKNQNNNENKLQNTPEDKVGNIDDNIKNNNSDYIINIKA